MNAKKTSLFTILSLMLAAASVNADNGFAHSGYMKELTKNGGMYTTMYNPCTEAQWKKAKGILPTLKNKFTTQEQSAAIDNIKKGDCLYSFAKNSYHFVYKNQEGQETFVPAVLNQSGSVDVAKTEESKQNVYYVTRVNGEPVKHNAVTNEIIPDPLFPAKETEEDSAEETEDASEEPADIEDHITAQPIEEEQDLTASRPDDKDGREAQAHRLEEAAKHAQEVLRNEQKFKLAKIAQEIDQANEDARRAGRGIAAELRMKQREAAKEENAEAIQDNAEYMEYLKARRAAEKAAEEEEMKHYKDEREHYKKAGEAELAKEQAKLAEEREEMRAGHDAERENLKKFIAHAKENAKHRPSEEKLEALRAERRAAAEKRMQERNANKNQNADAIKRNAAELERLKLKRAAEKAADQDEAERRKEEREYFKKSGEYRLAQQQKKLAADRLKIRAKYDAQRENLKKLITKGRKDQIFERDERTDQEMRDHHEMFGQETGEEEDDQETGLLGGYGEASDCTDDEKKKVRNYFYMMFSQNRMNGTVVYKQNIKKCRHQIVAGMNLSAQIEMDDLVCHVEFHIDIKGIMHDIEGGNLSKSSCVTKLTTAAA